MNDLFGELTQTEDAISAAKRIANSVNESYYDMGCLLYNIKENDLYKTIDGNKYFSEKHSKWKEFVEENFSVQYRSAQYWLNIYRYFSDMGVSKERLAQVGWSKAKEMIDVTDDVNVLEQCIRVAEEGTIQDLRAHIATIDSYVERLGQDQRETLTSKIFTFKFQEAAAETVQQILDSVAQDCGGNMNEAFFRIVIEWYQSQGETKSVDDIITIAYDGATDDNGDALPQELSEIFA